MSRRYTKKQRRSLRNAKAAKAVRERRAGLPFQRACARVRVMVEQGDLPPGCTRVIEAMARCHADHGAGVADRELLLGYGARGDAKRVEARARAPHAEQPVFAGIAEEAQLSRRYVISCVARLVVGGILRKWFGGPKEDYRQNVQPVLQRPNGEGERQEVLQGIGGSGWANAYTVEGIEDPVPPDPPVPPGRGLPVASEPGPDYDRARAKIREINEGLERDRIERLRRRLATEPSRGP